MNRLLMKEFGLTAGPLQPLSGGRVNRLWRCGNHVVKQYDHRQIPRERAIRAIELQARVAAAGLPVPAPLLTRTGALWADSDDGLVMVMAFVGGQRRVRGSLTGTEAANLGTLLGRLHGVLRGFPAEHPRPPYPHAIGDRWEQARAQALALEALTEFDQIVVEAAGYVADALGRMAPVDWDGQPSQLCHGDLHLDNLLFDGDGRVVGLIDFDNAAPGWAGVELLLAWNLCFCPDPGEPALTPEARLFFAAYQAASAAPVDLAWSLRAYWYTLASNTWPAEMRYRAGTVKPEWVEILAMRHRAARWVETHLDRFTHWLSSQPDAPPQP